MSLTFTAAVRANKPKRNVGKIHFSCAITRKGTVFGWGGNSQGSLGDNSIIDRCTPVTIYGTIKTFCEISSNGNTTVAIDKNGRAWGWGSNGGNIGDNTFTQRLTPVSVLGATKTFCAITSGGATTGAIDKNGRVWTWGDSTYGQLGNNTGGFGVCVATPVSILGAVKTFCRISGGVGSSNFMAIDKNGRAWGWGLNNIGQLGDNTIVNKSTPVSVTGTIKTFCEISTGTQTLAIDKNGRAWGWGYNVYGQVGDNSIISKLTPVSVLGTVKTFCKINAGTNSSFAIDKNGKVWTWGRSSGTNNPDPTATHLTPVSIYGNKTFCQIFSGAAVLAIDKNNRLWAWGSANQAGVNYIYSRITPVAIRGLTKTFCSIGAGGNTSGAIDKNGRIWMWGRTEFGQLGDNSNTTASQYTPVSILGAVKTFCHISVGGSILAIDKNGQVWGWGPNHTGQLGDNTTTSRRTPVSILGATKTFCKISVGVGTIFRFAVNTQAVAIDKYGRAWGWGRNGYGQLGDNTITQRNTPVSVLGATKTFCQISSSTHTLAIDKNGRAWGWGLNAAGQLGDNSTISKLTPVSVLGAVKTFCKISAGHGSHSAAIDKNGKVWTWGNNALGQLGDNTVVSKSTPIAISGATKTFCEIYCGSNSTLAIDKYGQIWSWGYNLYGILGDNSLTDKCTPVSIVGAKKTFCKVTIGGPVQFGGHSMAVDKDGKVWAWGSTIFGQLGIDIGTTIRTPVQVCNI